MAKAKEITGLDCHASAFDWSAKVLNVRFEEVCELRDATLDFSDLEGVHAMRVATRRLRGALQDFAALLQKRPLRHVREELKTIARALGQVRDQDVAIIALEKLQNEAPTEQIKRGIATFLNERQDLREKSRLALTDALAIGKLDLLQANFIGSIKPKNGKKHLQTLSFDEAGRSAVSESLNHFYKLGENLYAPFAADKLHELRIAAKQLRYAIELFTACWGKQIEPFAEQIAEMQAALGEVHDCDLWIEALGVPLRNQDGEKFQAAIWLLSNFVKKRTASYRSALKLWGKWTEINFVEEMHFVIAPVDQ